MWLGLALGFVLGWISRGAANFRTASSIFDHVAGGEPHPSERTYSKSDVGAVHLHHSARRKPQDENLLKKPV
jgi:hypothetical protein